VYFSYGDERANGSLFPTYGFVQVPNYYDCVTLTFQLNENDPLFEKKLQELEDPDTVQKQSFEATVNLVEGPTAKMISFCRFLAVLEVEDDRLTGAYDGHIPKICIENEVNAWELISKMCDEKLAKYPSTLD